MNAWKPILIALALMAALPLASEGASTNCKEPLQGTWSFGQAPQGCSLNTDAAPLLSRYSALIFDEARGGAEKKRYTESMHAFLRDTADYYLDQRRSEPTKEERLEWRRAVMALAEQESYWTHYRYTAAEKNLKFMRGDSGYGHGILQIDERWHPKLTMSAKGEDLASNLMYGLDIYFQAWERAPKAKCVKKGDFELRARAAYSAYNGGSGKICRFTKKKDKWARNDRGFLQKYQDQNWLKYVTTADARSPVDVSCAVEGGLGCGEGVAASRAIYWNVADAPKTSVKAVPAFAMALRSVRNKNSLIS